ncbi:MAG: helix-turn-helix transcriptional regulator [Chloroflexi bacterium]|nr:helix-turn-helix transcriptional regulator [Chloroflexota bacterium]
MRHSIASGHPGHKENASHDHPGGRLHRRLQPWLLLLLLQKPSYGYELMERLSQSEDTPFADVGLLYRTLRHLEEEGMVRSTWDTQGKGPARRLYEVTPEGAEYLDAWAADIRQLRKRLGSFLTKYQAYSQRGKGTGDSQGEEANHQPQRRRPAN